MADVWPVSLPQSPLQGSLTLQSQDNVLRGPADAGEGLRRQRFSAVSQGLNFTMNMTAAQLATLAAFYTTTLGGGVKRFEFTDPILGIAKEFSFVEPYQIQHVQADIFRVSFSLLRKAE